MRDKKSLELPKLFQNGCVLQQGEGTRIWGFGRPGMQVTVSIQGKQICTKISPEGRFEPETSRTASRRTLCADDSGRNKGKRSSFPGICRRRICMCRTVKYGTSYASGSMCVIRRNLKMVDVRVFISIRSWRIRNFSRPCRSIERQPGILVGRNIWKKLLLCLIFWGNIYMKKGEFLLEF